METLPKISSEITTLPVAESNVTLPAIDGRTAVLYSDPEAVASAIKKKIDKDLDDLKPHPPNMVQKILRVAAYPLGVVSGLLFAHREARDGIEKYADENKHFNDIPQAQFSDKDVVGKDRLEAHVDEMRTNIQAKERKLRVKLGMNPEKPTGFVEKFIDELEEGRRTIRLASVDPARKARIVFNGLFATSAAIGLALTLSDNKNFLHFGKDSNVDKDVSLDR